MRSGMKNTGQKNLMMLQDNDISLNDYKLMLQQKMYLILFSLAPLERVKQLQLLHYQRNYLLIHGGRISMNLMLVMNVVSASSAERLKILQEPPQLGKIPLKSFF